MKKQQQLEQPANPWSTGISYKIYLENMRSPTVSTFHNMKIVTSPEEIENDRITDSVLDDIKSIIQSTKNKDLKIRICIFSFINLTSFYCDIHNLSSSVSKYMPV